MFATEWTPAFYQTEPTGLTPQTKNALLELKKISFNGTEQILDIGCGTGEITRFIGEILPHAKVHGIDISKSMIQTAIKKNTQQNISFECISLFDYEPTAKFDVVVCFWVLYLFENYEQALRKVVSFLKPHGVALICHIVALGTPFDQLLINILHPRTPTLQFPYISTILHAIENSGNQIKTFEVKYAHDHYANFEDFICSMKSIPFYQNLLTPKEETIFFKLLPSIYPLEKDGSVIDSALIVSMILSK